MESRHHERHGLVWPVILIGAGVVLLMGNLGLLPWGAWQTLFSMWPVLLIIAGLDLLVGRRSTWGALLAAMLAVAVLAGALWFGLTQAREASTYRTETVTQSLGGATEGIVEIESGAGALMLDALTEATGNLIEGALQLSPGETVSPSDRRSGNTLSYSLRSEGGWSSSLTHPWPADKAWKLSLSRDVPIRLRVKNGVGRSELNLAQLTVPDVTVDGGVGEVVLTLPQRGQTTATIDGGVGGLEIVVPGGMAVRVRVDGGLGGVTTQGAFQKTGNTYTSPGYASAENRADVTVKGGVGGVKIREAQGE